jgi:hypothetical protein
LSTVSLCAECGAEFVVTIHRRKFCGVPCMARSNGRAAAAASTAPLWDRFWPKVAIGSLNECWLWQAAVRNGYGAIGLGERNTSGYAHRVVYEWAHGPIPAGLDVCHACDVRYPAGDFTYRRCVNPLHLWAGTRAENLADMTRKGRRYCGPYPSLRTPFIPCPVCGQDFKPIMIRPGIRQKTCSWSCSNRLRPRGIAVRP